MSFYTVQQLLNCTLDECIVNVIDHLKSKKQNQSPTKCAFCPAALTILFSTSHELDLMLTCHVSRAADHIHRDVK